MMTQFPRFADKYRVVIQELEKEKLTLVSASLMAPKKL